MSHKAYEKKRALDAGMLNRYIFPSYLSLRTQLGYSISLGSKPNLRMLSRSQTLVSSMVKI